MHTSQPNTKILANLILAAGMTLASPAWGADEVPYGHQDFFPSPERPIGYRGDGSGWFPGATPPTVFSAGTVIEIEGLNKKNRISKGLDLGDDTAVNVRWFAPTPSWGNNPPLVVGDKLYCFGEPDWVFCFATDDGSLLWQRRCSPWHASGLETATAERIRDLFGVYLALSTTSKKFQKGSEITNAGLIATYLASCHERILKRLAEIDPETDYTAAGASTRAYLEDYLERSKSFDPQRAAKDGVRQGNREYSWRKADALRLAIGERIEALGPEQPEIILYTPWGNMMGHVMQSPVSDGERLYAQLGQGQVVALDLDDGTVLWQTLLQRCKGNETYMRSPLLAEGVLACPVTGPTITGLDAATGEVLWEAPEAPTPPEEDCRHCASDCIVRLGEGAARRTFVATTFCNLIDIRTGEVAASLPFVESFPPIKKRPNLADCGYSMFPVPHPDGGVVLQKSGYPKEAIGYRVWLEDGKVEVEELYRTKKLHYGITGIPVTPTFIMGKKCLVDPLTGAELATTPGRIGQTIVAGSYAISPQHKGAYGVGTARSSWGLRGEADKALACFAIIDVGDPTAPQMVSDRNLIGGTALPRSIDCEALIPELWASSKFYGADGGKPAHAYYQDTGMVAHGPCLYIRTVPGLWCIGGE